MRAAIILLALLACAPKATGMARLDNRLGQAFCTANGPRAMVDIDVIESADSAFVKQHERMHMEQIRRFPTCRAFEVWYVVNTAEAEAEAFCAGATALAAGGDMSEPIKKAATWLAFGYPELQVSFPDALLLISGYCAK